MQLFDKTKEIFNTEKENARRGLLKFILAVPFWLILAAVFCVAFGIGRAFYLIDTRPDQRIAEVWQSSSDTSFRHMSVYAGGIRAQGDKSPLTYMEGGKSIHLADIALMRKDLQASAVTGSAASSKSISNSDSKLIGWEDCYSSTVIAELEAIEVREGLEVTTGKTDAQLVAVGGNYRAFHPFRYLSGGFLPETPVDANQIVINDVLAWKFYRSYDVTGNRIIINGQMFTIIGVVEEKNTKVAELAGEQDCRAFIYFGALGTIYDTKPNNGDDGEDYNFSGPADYAIQCYEALLPELVKGVGVSDFKNAMPSYSFTNPQLYVEDNTGRFGLFRVFDTVFPLGETDRERMGYEFPYWEKAAQLTEDRLFYDYVIIFLGIVLLLIGLVMIGLKLRARKAVAPDELEYQEPDEPAEGAEKGLILKELP